MEHCTVSVELIVCSHVGIKGKIITHNILSLQAIRREYISVGTATNRYFISGKLLIPNSPMVTPRVNPSRYFLHHHIINFRVASFDLWRLTWRITPPIDALLTANFNARHFNSDRNYTALVRYRGPFDSVPRSFADK